MYIKINKGASTKRYSSVAFQVRVLVTSQRFSLCTHSPHFHLLFSTLQSSNSTLSPTTLYSSPIMKTITLFIIAVLILSNVCLHLATTDATNHYPKTTSKEQIQCTMCAACDNPCNQVPSPPPPSSTNNCPPPPSPPTSSGGGSSGGSYYYSPPSHSHTYSSPPPPPPSSNSGSSGGGTYYYYPPPSNRYYGPTPPPPNPIVPYFPFYYHSPPPPSSAPTSSCSLFIPIVLSSFIMLLLS